nr:hypothetical protein I308_03453 [Cryptococcus tetragattii IND107]
MDNELSVFGKTLQAFKVRADIWQQQQITKGMTSLEKLWSINTPKTHMMGHTSLCIQSFGLTVGYTMEMSELQHKDSKGAYANSNKGPNKDFQIARRAFQRHRKDGICWANKLRRSGKLRRSRHDLQRPIEKMTTLHSNQKTWDMGHDLSCTSATKEACMVKAFQSPKMEINPGHHLICTAESPLRAIKSIPPVV